MNMHSISSTARRFVKALIILCMMLWSGNGWAQIAYDSFVDIGNNGGVGALSGSFNNAAGNVMFIVVVGDLNGGADDVNPPTYNGIASTLVDKNTGGSANNRDSYFYILQNPATGSHTLSVTSTTDHFLIMGAVSYSGAATSGQPDAHLSSDSGGNASTLTSSLTTVADNSWVVIAATQQQLPAAGAGFTQRGTTGSFSTWMLGDSNGVVHPAGSYSVTTTQAVATSYIFHLKASIKPPGGATTRARVIGGRVF